MASKTASVSVIGLGNIGSALANALLRAGHRVTVWNRTSSKADTLLSQGAVLADSAISCLTASPLTIICVLSDDAVRASLSGLGAETSTQLFSHTLVNLTNGSPNQARGTGEWLARLGLTNYIHGGVMVPPHLVGGPHCFTVYSGSSTAFEEHENTLAAIGASKFVGSDAGSASLYDVGMLTAMYGLLGGYFHSIAMMKAAGLSAVEFTNNFIVPFMPPIVQLLPEFARQVDSEEFGPKKDGSPMGMLGVSLDNIIATSNELGIKYELMSVVKDWVEKRVKSGGWNDEMSSVLAELHQ